jgi:hypothetical protein
MSLVNPSLQERPALPEMMRLVMETATMLPPPATRTAATATTRMATTRIIPEIAPVYREEEVIAGVGPPVMVEIMATTTARVVERNKDGILQ